MVIIGKSMATTKSLRNSRINKSIAAALLAFATAWTWGAPSDDIRLVMQAQTTPNWATMPIAVPRHGAPFDIRLRSDPQQEYFASLATVRSQWWTSEITELRPPQVIQADFDADGRTDIALLNRGTNPSWNTMPVAYAKSDGSVSLEYHALGLLEQYSQNTTARVVVGYFNNDKRPDIALIDQSSRSGWNFAPVLLSQTGGLFASTQWSLGDFARKAAAIEGGWYGQGARGGDIVVGDFNNDGYSDLVVVYPCGSDSTLSVAYTQPGGHFVNLDHPASGFLSPCSGNPARVVAGDFNGDGKTDLARFVNGTMVVATSTGTGFNVSAPIQNDFTKSASVSNVSIVAGKFDSNVTTDMALINSAGSWDHVLMAFGVSGSAGQFSIKTMRAPTFAYYAAAGAQVRTGDFDGNGQTDIALIPRPGTASANWSIIPIAYLFMETVQGPVTACLTPFACKPTSTTTTVPVVRDESQSAPNFTSWMQHPSAVMSIGNFVD
jgi:hypothetical protein